MSDCSNIIERKHNMSYHTHHLNTFVLGNHKALSQRFRDSITAQRWKPVIYMPNKEGIMSDIVHYMEPTLPETSSFKDKRYPKLDFSPFSGYFGVECQDLINGARIDP